MIGPVSSTGRAMMASLQQAMAKGMPADQAIAYVKSMAQQGVAPLTDLYSMLTQFQRLKQQPAQMPQTPPTVRDQINMAAQQRDMQERAMAQGLGGMNAGSMENPSFAGGGIVAFAEGDLVTPYGGAPSMAQERIRLTNAIKNAIARGAPPEEIASLKSDLDRLGLVGGPGRLSEGALNQKIRSMGIAPAMEQFAVAPEAPEFSVAEEAAPDLMRESAERSVGKTDASKAKTAPAAREEKPSLAKRLATPAEDKAAEKPKSIEDYEEEVSELYKSRGIGKATEDYRKFLEEERSRGEKEGKTAKSLALAKAGFRMAQAAARPGATFMESLGAGGEEYATQLEALRRDQQTNNRNLREAQFRLAQADELQAAGRIKDAYALREKAQDEARRARERSEDNAYRYAVLRSEESREGARLRVQQAVADYNRTYNTDKLRIDIADAERKALSDLGKDLTYLGYVDEARKAEEDGDTKARDAALKKAQEYKMAQLAPINAIKSQLNLGGVSSGASSNQYSGFKAVQLPQ